MKKVFSSNKELIDIFANEVQDAGRSGSMSFGGGVLWSYNTAIAEHVTNENGEHAIIVNRTSYSNTTSKQQSILSSSIPNYKKQIYIRFISYGKQSLKPNWLNKSLDNVLIERYERNANDLLIKASKARTKKDYYQAEAIGLLNELKEYAAFFGIEYNFECDTEALQNAAITRAENERVEAEKVKQKRIADQAEALEKWRNGEKVSNYFEVTALRLNGDIIQTSRGADIPKHHAIKVWSLLKKLHQSNGVYVRGESSVHLGHYTLDRFENDVLYVGCHTIPFSEVQLIANKLNLS